MNHLEIPYLVISWGEGSYITHLTWATVPGNHGISWDSGNRKINSDM